MRVIAISDTHGLHPDLDLPDGDLLIHAGDFSRRGEPREVESFLQWFSSRSHEHKVCIAGNHDFLAERDPGHFRRLLPHDVTYLEESGVEIEGLEIWGSPITPWFFDWAFNRQRGEEIRSHWKKIPATTDILVTHGPPYEILDRTTRDEDVGCEELRQWVDEHAPRLHIFGHIHEAQGQLTHGGTLFVNASILDHRYRPAYDPVVVDL